MIIQSTIFREVFIKQLSVTLFNEILPHNSKWNLTDDLDISVLHSFIWYWWGDWKLVGLILKFGFELKKDEFTFGSNWNTNTSNMPKNLLLPSFEPHIYMHFTMQIIMTSTYEQEWEIMINSTVNHKCGCIPLIHPTDFLIVAPKQNVLNYLKGFWNTESSCR